jgi:tetratricopeptide (TPR) repeat protein
VSDLLRSGIAAAKAGRKQEARRILLQVTELDERNEQAWLWLSGLVETLDERRICLENVLSINPGNTHASHGLDWLDEQVTPPSGPHILQQTTQYSEYRDGVRGRFHDLRSSVQQPTTPSQPQGGRPRAVQLPIEEDKCPRCQASVPTTGTMCPECGQVLIVACPNCGEYIEVEHVTCPECAGFLGDFRDGARYHLLLAKAYMERQKFALAQEAVDRAEAEALDDPKAMEAVAILHERMGHTDQAIQAYQLAIERHPESAICFARLGDIYRRRSMPDDARAMYERAVELDRNDPGTLVQLADLYLDGGQAKGALRLLEHAVKVDPGHAEANMLLGNVYMKLGKSKQAVQQYERSAVLSKPTSAVGQAVQHKLVKVRPGISEHHAQGWGETFRRVAGLMLLPVLAALVNARVVPPLEIRPGALLALGAALFGSFLWAFAVDVPRNDIMRVLFGEQGLEKLWQKVLIGLPGVALWGAGLGVILVRL